MTADIIGILGFALSIFILVLTRWERRKKLAIHLEITYESKFKDAEPIFEHTDSIMIIFRMTNIGGKPILIDKDSFLLEGNGRKIQVYDTDWLGMDQIPYPLNPGSSCEVEIFAGSVDQLLGGGDFTPKDVKDLWVRYAVPIKAEVKDLSGKKYKCNNLYEYNFEVSDIAKKKNRIGKFKFLKSWFGLE